MVMTQTNRQNISAETAKSSQFSSMTQSMAVARTDGGAQPVLVSGTPVFGCDADADRQRWIDTGATK